MAARASSAPGARALVMLVAIAIATTGFEPAAHAYEFEVRARTTGQGAELRTFRLLGDRGSLTRRQVTQSLSLRIWDLFVRRLDIQRKRRLDHDKGPKFYFHSHLRIDHDFGTFTTGDAIVGSAVFDAVDAVGELEERSLQVDLTVAYVAADDLLDGRLDLRLGRQLEIGGMDFVRYDGVRAEWLIKGAVAVAGYGGLRVRRDSFLGFAGAELDGTSDTGCQEYVEGPIPGSGSWRPIDLGPFDSDDNDPFRNDTDRCPQREVRMPVYGLVAMTRGNTPVRARLDYRKSLSRAPGLIGDVDRFENPDTGVYPNEIGQTDGFGTNEEIASASVRAPLPFDRGRSRVTPHGAIRWNALHATIDQAHLGTALKLRRHHAEAEIYYYVPTFDGDSIFNVFSVQPYTDVRATYSYDRDQVSAFTRGFVRRFHSEDVPDTPAMDGALSLTSADGDEHAYGGAIGAVWRPLARGFVRVELFAEGGYGGGRLGGYGTGSVPLRHDLTLATRLSAFTFDLPNRDDRDGFSSAVEAGLSYQINKGLSAKLAAEQTTSPLHPAAYRLWAVFDIALHPDI